MINFYLFLINNKLMERFKDKNIWQKVAVGLGGVGMAFLGHLLYKKFSSGKSLPGGLNNGIISLSKSEAMSRSNLIKNLKYTLFVLLRSDHAIAARNIFDGTVLLEFDLNKSEDLFIDFHGEITKVMINGESIKDITRINDRIYIPAKYLRLQSNKIKISYSCHYSHVSKGLKHYLDPEDMVIIILFL